MQHLVALLFVAVACLFSAPASASTHAYLKFDNLTTGESVAGGVDGAGIVGRGFALSLKRDLSGGPRVIGAQLMGEILTTVPRTPEVFEAMRWVEEGDEVRLDVVTLSDVLDETGEGLVCRAWHADGMVVGMDLLNVDEAADHARLQVVTDTALEQLGFDEYAEACEAVARHGG
jgi:hypothetical protein